MFDWCKNTANHFCNLSVRSEKHANMEGEIQESMSVIVARGKLSKLHNLVKALSPDVINAHYACHGDDCLPVPGEDVLGPLR